LGGPPPENFEKLDALRGVFPPSQKLKDISTKCTFWVDFVGKTLVRVLVTFDMWGRGPPAPSKYGPGTGIRGDSPYVVRVNNITPAKLRRSSLTNVVPSLLFRVIGIFT
jgi:hypothetical protein